MICVSPPQPISPPQPTSAVPSGALLRDKQVGSASTGRLRLVDPAECIAGEVLARLDRLGDSNASRHSDSRSTSDIWIVECNRVLERLKELEEDWDAYGAAPPNATAISLAKTVIRELGSMDLCEFRVEPSVEEGICVSFRSGDVYADIETFNSGEVVAAFSDGRDTPTVWEMEPTNAGIRQAAHLIRDHLIDRKP